MSSESPREKRSISAKAVIAIILVILGVIFIAQNTGSGSVHFLFWRFSIPAWIWILIIFLIGIVVGSIFPWFRSRRRR